MGHKVVSQEDGVARCYVAQMAALKSNCIFWFQCPCWLQDSSTDFVVHSWGLCERNALLEPFPLPPLTEFSRISHICVCTHTRMYKHALVGSIYPSSSLTTAPRMPNVQRLVLPSHLFSDHASCCSLPCLSLRTLLPGLIYGFLQCPSWKPRFPCSFPR